MNSKIIFKKNKYCIDIVKRAYHMKYGVKNIKYKLIR